MKTNKKLSLNKHIVSNLDDIKGEGIFTLQKFCKEIGETIIITIQVSWDHCFSGDPKGICQSDLCTIICQSNGCNGATQEYASCFGGSCGKCG